MPNLLYASLDALHLSIPAQGLPNGDAALQHAAYPGMQPYPGVGEFETLSQHFFFLLINSMLSIYWIFGKCISYCGFPEFYFLYISLTLTWILIHMLRLLFWYICSIYYNLYLSYQCYVSCAVVLFPEIPYLHFWFHSLFDAKKTIYLLIYWFPQVFSAIRHWILCEKNGHSDRP